MSAHAGFRFILFNAILVTANLCLQPCIAGDDAKKNRQRELAGPYYNLEYRLIGPAASGRVSRGGGSPW